MELNIEIKKATDPIYQKVSKVIPEIEWSVHAPYIHKINKLKKEKNAVILAHNYQTPEIYHGVADFSADSLALAIEASKTSADIILMAGVHFMAETAKLMSPNKKVILPDMDAGCSLSSSITGKDVRLLKEKYPKSQFIVIYYDALGGGSRYPYDHDEFFSQLQDRDGIRVLNVSAMLREPYDDARYYVNRYNQHPNAEAFSLIADYLVKKLQ